jgi:hypothetical protein
MLSYLFFFHVTWIPQNEAYQNAKSKTTIKTTNKIRKKSND